MKFCKYCGAQISEQDRTCPNCGKLLGAEISISNRTGVRMVVARVSEYIKKLGKQWAIILSAALAAVIIIVMVVVSICLGNCNASGCNNKTVSGSDYCYSHKCALESCKNSRFVSSNYCYSHYLLYDKKANEITNSILSSDLKISNVRLSSNSSYTIAEGTITNNGSKTVEYVKIKGSFENRTKSVVDTDWTYAVGSEGLKPGESTKWRMSVKKDTSISNCTVTILDFD